MGKNMKKYIIYLGVLLVIIGLSVGFSAFQRQILIDNNTFTVRLQEDTRVSNSIVQKVSGNAVSNETDYNREKILGNITFSSTSSYVLYKVSLTNYGNVKTGLLSITNNSSGVNYSICDSNGNNCSNNVKTPVCNGSNCTLGSTKDIYVKVSSSSTGTKEVNLDLNFQPYHTITYENFRENTSSFPSEIMENDTLEITLTNDVEEIDVVGGSASYNKNTGILTINGATDNMTITAKYLLTDVAQTTYSGSDPNNYVLFGTDLYRIITKDAVNDGYDNNEFRAKITKDSSIGNYIFDNNTNIFRESSLRDVLNTTYYNSLSDTQKGLIDTVYFEELTPSSNLYGFVEYFLLISNNDYNSSGNWIKKDQYILHFYTSEVGKILNKDKIIASFDKESTILRKVSTGYQVYAISNGSIVTIESDTLMPTYPTTYLQSDVLVVGGSGTRANPYRIEKKSNGLIANPTIITGINNNVNGSNQNLVTVTNKVGTVYYSTSQSLNSANYTSGSTTIPKASAAGTYYISYYIPEGSGYKAKSGRVIAIINPLTFTVTYQKGNNVTDIGKTGDSCSTSGTALSCSVTLPSITPNTGYDSVGWSTTNGATTGTAAGSAYTLSSNGVRLYANAVEQRNYQNTSTFAYYGNLNRAFSSINNNQTIKVLQNVTESTSATLANNKTGIKLDLNGKTITFDEGKKIINNGTLDIYNSSSTVAIITGVGNEVIYNYNTLSINGTSNNRTVTISQSNTGSSHTAIVNGSSSSLTINNNVNINVTASSSSGVNNLGNMSMLGGTIAGTESGISNSGTLTISSGNITGTTNGINNTGTVTISNATITGTTRGIYNSASGQLNITGSSAHITGSGTTSSGIDNIGTITMSNGTISGVSYGINNTSSVSSGTTNYGITTITNGTVTGNVRGIYNATGATLTLGVNDSDVSSSNPTVQSINTSSSYGVNNNNGIFNFYDGVIKSNSGSGKAINGTVSSTPSGYDVYKETVSGVESAYLLGNYLNTSTGNSYITLNAAFSAVANNETIKVMKNVIETTTSNLGSGKTGIKLDLNGKTISYTGSTSVLYNKSELDIYNSSSTDGIIEGSYDKTIRSEAKLTLNGTSDQNKIIIRNTYPASADAISFSSSNNVINNNVVITTDYGNGVRIGGLTTIYDAEISGTTGIYARNTFVLNGTNAQIAGSGTYAIYSDGTATVNAGTITGGSYGIYNAGTMTVSNATVTGLNNAIYNRSSTANITISGGTFTGTNDCGLNNEGTVLITGGTFEGTCGINTGTSNTVTITGGTITGRTSSGISRTGAALTIGTNDGTVNTNSPIIQTNATSGIYGISSNYNIYFYDGIVKSASGEGYSLGGPVIDVPSGYAVYKETSNGIESAYLLIPGLLMEGTSSGNFLRTNINRANIEKITFADSISGHTPNGTNCWDVSLSSDRSVLAWANDIDGNGKYEITIGGRGKVVASSGKNLFNSLTNLKDLNGMANFDTSKVTDMSYMFNNCTSLKSLDLSYFDTTKVTNMERMFYGCSNIEYIIATSNFNTSLVTNSSNMFYGVTSIVGGNGTVYSSSHINKEYARLDEGTTTPGYFIKQGGILIAGIMSSSSLYINYAPIAKTSVEEITFQTSLNPPSGSLGSWRVHSSDSPAEIRAFYTDADGNGKYEVFIGSDGIIYAPINSTQLFNGFTGLKRINNLKYLNTSRVTNFKSAFYSCSSLQTLDLSSFDTSNVTDMSSMFDACSSLVSIDLSSFDTSKVTTMEAMFRNNTKLESLNLTNFNTSKVTNMVSMFSMNQKLSSLDISSFDTSNVTNMRTMFYSCDSLVTLDVSNFDTSKVTNMDSMFAGGQTHTGGLTSNLVSIIGLDNFNTSNVTDMGAMFEYLGQLTSLDVSHFDTSKVTDMSYMFYGCAGLTSLDVSNFVTSNVTDMSGMFGGLTYTLDDTNLSMNLESIIGLDNFDTSKVTNMRAMFKNCNKIVSLDLSSFDTSNVTNMAYMFQMDSELKTIYANSNFNTSNVTNANNMFSSCTSLVGGAGTVYDSNYIDKTYAHVDGGTSNPGYFTNRSAPANAPSMNNLNNKNNSLTDLTKKLLNTNDIIKNEIDRITQKGS